MPKSLLTCRLAGKTLVKLRVCRGGNRPLIGLILKKTRTISLISPISGLFFERYRWQNVISCFRPC